MRSIGFALLVVFVSALPTPALVRAEEAAISQAELIEQLGHPVYAERRDARRRLRSLGLSAFDALRNARDHDDPEIAEASRQLLGEVIESWVWPGDSLSAREVLEEYGEGYVDVRLEYVLELAKLPLERGVAPLVRIARFDASDNVARSAAAALLDSAKYPLSPSHERALAEAVTDLNAKYGAGTRWAAEWLDLAATEAERPDAIAAWRSQSERLEQASESHQEGATLWIREQVLWRGLRAALRVDNAEAASQTVTTLLELEPEAAPRRLSRALEWVVDAGASQAAARLEQEHAESLRDKRGLYRRAELALRFGRPEEAESLAAEAMAADAPLGTGPRAALETLYGPAGVIALELRNRGRSDWAVAEYEASAGVFAADKPISGTEALVAWRLAEIHYDAARYAEASAALSPLVAVCKTSQSAKERYDNLPQVKYGYLPRRGELESHTLLCRALAAHDAGDGATAQAELLQAIRYDSDNADIAIAMHRIANPTEDFAKKTEQVTAEMKRLFEQRIWEWEESDNPNRDPRKQANQYNHWAWLIGNTTGDYDKAVRYSRRSLQILPDTAGYLDTLGRCLFSAGRVEEAIEAQRRAVELEPAFEVMRRQLAEFEAALPADESL